MKIFLKNLGTVGLGLSGVLVLGAVLQAGTGPQPDRWTANVVQSAPGKVYVMAQNADQGKEKPAPEATAPKKAKAARSMEAPAPRMERDESKSGMIGGEPERAGTEKIGGQVIRAKEGPSGE